MELYKDVKTLQTQPALFLFLCILKKRSDGKYKIYGFRHAISSVKTKMHKSVLTYFKTTMLSYKL